MKNNEKNISPLNSTNNSKNEIKTVYINDIESLNDSTENNDTSLNNLTKLSNNFIKSKLSTSITEGNILINKKENIEIKNISLNKISKIKKVKEQIEKIEKNKSNNSKKEEIYKKEKDEIYHKKNKLASSKHSEEFDRNLICRLISNKNSENKLLKKEGEKYFSDNENEIIKNLKNKYSKYKKNNNIDINIIKENEKEMIKEIDFLKKEIQLKNNIIQKLIEENKNLIEKIKIKEIELFNSKNKEENLARIIEDNNKCISNLNELILKLIPQNERNRNQKLYTATDTNISKSKIEKNNLQNIFAKNLLINKLKEKKFNKSGKNNLIINDNNIHLNKNKEKTKNKNNVQRYFKIQTRNNIKKHISLNQNNKFNDTNKENKEYYNNTNDNEFLNILNINGKKYKKLERIRRNNTISMDLKKINNSSSVFINDTINYINNHNLFKSSTNSNNIMKKKNYNNIRYNIDFVEDNKNDPYLNYFTNISCKNENINQYLDISAKKFDSNSNINISSNDIFSKSNIDNKFKIPSPKITSINEKKNKSSDKTCNLKFLKNLSVSNRENQKTFADKLNSNKILCLKDEFIKNNNNQSFSIKNINNNIPKLILVNDFKKAKANSNYFSPRNKDIKFKFNEKKNKKREKNNYKNILDEKKNSEKIKKDNLIFFDI